jgi:hypothetical protein
MSSNFTLATVAAAGAIRYVKGPERNFPAQCFFFLREDVMKIKHAFEKHSVAMTDRHQLGQQPCRLHRPRTRLWFYFIPASVRRNKRSSA